MSEQTFTIEQIEKAIDKLSHRSLEGDVYFNHDELITALTEPEFKPEVGQVAMRENGNGKQMPIISGDSDFLQQGKKRPLNQTEAGPDWVPKVVFVKLLDALSYYKSSKVINEVLASLPEEYRGLV